MNWINLAQGRDKWQAVVNKVIKLLVLWIVVKGPAADATDAPQPGGFLCNPVMMTLMMMIIIIFCLFLVTEHRWSEIDRGKPKYSEKNLSQCHFVDHKSHMD
jgi:hypothetical protein